MLKSPSALVQFIGEKFGEGLKNRTLYPVYYTAEATKNPGCLQPSLLYSQIKACIDISVPLWDELSNSKNINQKGVDLDKNKIRILDLDPVVAINTTTTKILQYLFISDKENHCIRKVDLSTAEVTTYAGKCGTPGFKDGGPEISRFTRPDAIGIDDDGYVYVYDSGNSYMRIIRKDQTVFTLINGACFEYKLQKDKTNIYNHINNYLICFRKWIKTSGLPDGHIVSANQNVNTCQTHWVLCDNSSQVYDRNISLNYAKNLYTYTADDIKNMTNTN